MLPASTEQQTRASGESAVEILDRMAISELDTPQWQAQEGALLGPPARGQVTA